MPRSVRIFLWISIFAISSVRAFSADENEDFFERRVRPVLAANCWSCHGEKKQEANLRLDSRAAMLRGGDSGAVVVAGAPETSPLIDAIRWGGDVRMPPDNKLRQADIDVLIQWVRRGAVWPERSHSMPAEPWREHWAFRSVRRAELPAVTHTSWSRTAIDRFVLAELESRRLAPAAPADRRTLIRRTTFDLLGLPPTPEEISGFLADSAHDAYERLVDRLLASPQYGERWGRHWLDVARYADNKGYVFFEEKNFPWAYTYRDYVIRAWNSDLPFDRFVLEQLAADQLERGPDQRSLTALGFLTVGGHFMNNTHDILDDRIDVVSRGLLGLTVTCARCHDHKYDPITMADYYGLYGVFRSCYEPTVPPLFEPPPGTETYQKFAAEMATRENKLVDFVRQKHAELVRDARTRVGAYLWAAHQNRDQPPTDDFMLLVDKGDLNPTMILRWQVYLAAQPAQPNAVWTCWQRLADLPADGFAARAAATLARFRDGETTEAPLNRLLQEALERRPLESMQQVAERYGEVLQSIEAQWQQALAAATDGKQPPPQRLDDPAAEELRQVLYAEHSPPDVPLAMDWGFLSLFPDRPTQEEYKKLLKEVEQWMMTGAGAPPRAMVLLDDARPFEPRIFLRGNPHRLGDSVPRRFLSALDGAGRPFRHGSGRLELAQAVVDPANPLTARVLVNRIWLHHFGEGLVRTPSDFGLRSEPPTHPELLDWLAAEFIAQGWSIKWLHRQILLSATYRQSSRASSPGAANSASAPDPENRWLARAPRRRLDFESLRDALLAVADSLEMRLGGPPVDVIGEAVIARRTVYGSIDRMDVPPLLTTFDFPNPLTTSPQRTATTIAPQALYLMNSGFAAEIARRVAARPDVTALTDTNQRIARLFQLCLGRDPTAEEQAQVKSLLGGAATADDWQLVVHGLLLTNEFLFVD